MAKKKAKKKRKKKKVTKKTVKAVEPEKQTPLSAEPKLTVYPAAGAKVQEFEDALDKQHPQIPGP